MIRSKWIRINYKNTYLGQDAGLTSQGANCVAIGFSAGSSFQGIRIIAIGDYAGTLNQGKNSIAIGRLAIGTGGNSIAIGSGASTGIYGNSVAIGLNAIAGGDNQIMLGTVNETVSIPGNLNFSKRPQTWYISSTSNANATTAAGKNIGGSSNNTPSNVYWNIVTVFGGANASNWNTGTAVFTASQSGLYQFQFSAFVYVSSANQGRWLCAGGTCIPIGQTIPTGKFQYLSYGQSYIVSNDGMISVSCSFYMSAGETFFWYAQNVTPSFYYDPGHTYCQIIKVY